MVGRSFGIRMRGGRFDYSPRLKPGDSPEFRYDGLPLLGSLVPEREHTSRMLFYSTTGDTFLPPFREPVWDRTGLAPPRRAIA
jgi:hypothetical protein